MKPLLPGVAMLILARTQLQVSRSLNKVRRPAHGVPEDATPESMAEINDKLANELEQLINAVENQIDRVRKEKEEELKLLRNREEPDAEVRKKENELKKAQIKIQSLKKGISQMKKQIDNAYDVEKTLHLENELKNEQKKFETLESEVSSLKKVEKEQNKAFAILNNDEDADRRLESIREEVQNAKTEVREKNEQLRKVDEEMKTQHSQTIEMEQKCRKIEYAIKHKNDRKSQSEDENGTVLTKEQAQQRLAEVEELEHQKKQEEKKFQKLIRQVEAKITQVDYDKNIWSIKLKEKEQEFRLNELRIKELKRQVPHKALKPLNNKESSKNQKKRKQVQDPRAHMKKSLKNSPSKNKSTKKPNEEISPTEEKKTMPKAEKPLKVDQDVGRNTRNEVTLPKNNNKGSQDSQHENDKRENSPTPKEGPSALSGNKDGFYDNSFLEDENEDKKVDIASPRNRESITNTKTKPMEIKKEKSRISDKNDDDDNDNYDDDDYE